MWLSWQERSPHTIRTFAQSEILQLAYAFRIYLIINFYFYLSRTLYINKSRHKYGTNIRLKSIENEEIRETIENKNSSKLLSYCYLLFVWCSFVSGIISLLRSLRLWRSCRQRADRRQRDLEHRRSPDRVVRHLGLLRHSYKALRPLRKERLAVRPWQYR